MSKSNLAEKETRIFSEELYQLGKESSDTARRAKVNHIKALVRAGKYQPHLLSVAAVLDKKLLGFS